MDTDPLVEALRESAARHGVPFRDMCMCVRIALTGGTVSEPMGQLLRVIGKENTLKALARHGRD